VAVAPSGALAVVCEAFENRCQLFAGLTGNAAPEATPWWERQDAVTHFGRCAATGGGLLAVTEPEAGTVNVYDNASLPPVLVTIVGGVGGGFGQFLRPCDAAIDAQGNMLYVVDEGTRRLQLFEVAKQDGAPHYDPALAKFVRAYDLAALTQKLDIKNLVAPIKPSAIALFPNGNLLLADEVNARVNVFSPSMALIASWGGQGRETGQFNQPTDLAISPSGEIAYVLDAYNHRIQPFDATGKPVHEWGSYGTGPGRFMAPCAVTTARDGSVYVSDSATHTVQRFDPTGRHLNTIGREGLGAGEFFKPAGVALDAQGRLIVVDHGNHRLMFFDSKGEFLSAFGARAYVKPTESPEE
jgi:DNA-binding beta-propeller fold protein YncE